MKEFKYTKEELLLIENFSKSFSVINATQVIEYGKVVQDKLSVLSNKLLVESKRNNSNEITTIIDNIVKELNKLNKKKEKKGFLSLFKKEETTEPNEVQYETILRNVESLKDELQKHIITLNKDLQLLELLSDNNEEYLRELNMYIIAGKLILEKAKKDAADVKNDSLVYNDYMQAIDRFEKKLYDLELTKTMTFQMLPQISLMKDNTYILIDKINTIIKSTIPLCRSQLVILLSHKNQEKVMSEQSEISRLLNETLSSNSLGLAEMRKDLASELEKGIVSERTLQETTNELLKAIEEINKTEETIKESINEEPKQEDKPVELKLRIETDIVI